MSHFYGRSLFKQILLGVTIYGWLGKPIKLKHLAWSGMKLRLSGQAYPQTEQSMTKFFCKEAEEVGKAIDRCIEAETPQGNGWLLPVEDR